MSPTRFLPFLLLLLSVFQGTAIAQHAYNIDYITTESGLPSDGIKGLQWDERNGFLWVATEGGMVRYNGQQLVLFNKENVPELSSDKFFPLIKDLSGNVIAITNKYIFEATPNRLVKSNIAAPQRPGVPGNMLYVFVSAGPPAGSDPDINNFDKLLPVNTSLCFIHKSDSLFEYHAGARTKQYRFDVPHDGNSFMIGNRIFLYDGADNFFYFDTTTKQLLKLDLGYASANTSRFPAGKKHLYWDAGTQYPVILAGSDAWILNYKNNKLEAEQICSEIPQNYAIRYAQYWKKGEILFLGTQSKGIVVIRKNYLSSVKKNNSGFDEPNAIYAQLLLSNGNILTNTGDIIGPYTAPARQKPIAGPYNNNILLTKDSLLWYTIHDSLYYYDYKTSTRHFSTHYDGSYFMAFATTQNKVYVSNYKGVFLVSDTGIHKLIALRGTGDAFDMAELSPGVLVLAMGKGLFRYDIASGRFDTLLKKESAVRSLWKHGPYLFIGTYGDGIYILKDGIVKQMPIDNNNYLRYAHCFILDEHGFCWISTNRGLFKASLEDMIAAYEQNTPYIYYHFFGKNEGMDITEMNGGCKPCGIRLLNGDISFPTMDGALWVDPAMPVRLPDDHIFIDQVTANGRKLDTTYSDSLLFSSSVHDIAISVSFSSWCDKENVYIQYTLDSLAPVWQKMDINHPVIHLSNLAYGKYDLYIRKLKGFGATNFTIHKISFEIEAPWYLNWWGKLIIILAALLVITIISVVANRESLRKQRRLRNQLDSKTKEILKQNEKLEKNDRIKTRLISIISHDIITPLKYLHLTTKYLSEEKASLSENLRDETLQEVVNTSRELEMLSTNILNWIKYQNEERRIVREKINLHDLVEQVFTILRSLAHRNNIILSNNIPADLTVFQYTDPLRIILYNLVVNAINFTKDGTIVIRANQVYDNIQIQVKDSGLGMNKNQMNNLISENVVISSANVHNRSGNGLGYLIIKDLLKMIEGAFDIESEVNVGTSVYITFPAK